jgi:hypothetical protein
MYIGLRVKFRYCCQILMKLEFSRRIFKKYPKIEFHENPSRGSRVVQCQMTDRQTDMTKLIAAFSNSANAPKNPSMLYSEIIAVCTEIHTKHINTVRTAQ